MWVISGIRFLNSCKFKILHVVLNMLFPLKMPPDLVAKHVGTKQNTITEIKKKIGFKDFILNTLETFFNLRVYFLIKCRPYERLIYILFLQNKSYI